MERNEVHNTEVLKRLKKIQESVEYLGEFWGLSSLQSRIDALSAEIDAPDFWSAQRHAKQTMLKRSQLESQLNSITQYKSQLDLCNLMLDDPEYEKEIDQIVTELDVNTHRAKLSCVFDDEDQADCFVQVKAGAGGREARDWAQMLFSMYLRYGQKVGYKVSIVEESVDEDGMNNGLLQISASTNAQFPYGYLKYEAGTHRLVRISPFDANKNRHTSFASVDVFPVVDETISCDIDEADIECHYCRSSGPGGQHVNKTDSAVQLHHKPTGIIVRCQSGRSQIANKKQAMSILQGRLHQLELDKRQQAKKDRLASRGAIEWGSQIRSYVLQPYRLVKDTRTQHADQDPESVLGGDLQGFLDSAVSVLSIQHQD
jgi:peptide chain release factor 2